MADVVQQQQPQEKKPKGLTRPLEKALTGLIASEMRGARLKPGVVDYASAAVAKWSKFVVDALHRQVITDGDKRITVDTVKKVLESHGHLFARLSDDIGVVGAHDTTVPIQLEREYSAKHTADLHYKFAGVRAPKKNTDATATAETDAAAEAAKQDDDAESSSDDDDVVSEDASSSSDDDDEDASSGDDE